MPPSKFLLKLFGNQKGCLPLQQQASYWLSNDHGSFEAISLVTVRHNDSTIRIIGITEADAGRMFCST